MAAVQERGPVVTDEVAFGSPGVPPTWAPAAKQGVGTATTSASPLWFTIAQGVVTEVYYPRVDVPNTRDVQFLVLLPGGEVVEERRGTDAAVELLDPRALGYRVVTTDRAGRFRIDKRLVADPERPSLALRVRFTALAPQAAGARLFLLAAPHVAGHGHGNSARIVQRQGSCLGLAWRHDTWLALGASLPVVRASCGYVGASDGWTDLTRHGDMRWSFRTALQGNVAITAELAGFHDEPFTVVLGFGHTEDEACDACLATREREWADLEAEYVEGWRQWCSGLHDLSAQSGDGGRLYYLSAMTLRAHADKQNPGAHIASLAVPWGEATGDDNAGGYHLVWPRDLYHSATARLAAGDAAGARDALQYLFRTQRADGSWPQNFWVFGEPYWRGLQLDELAFPILLAWQLQRLGALDFNPYPSIVAPAAYAVARIGPVTPQERWEENAGYSPSTLASAIAALVCAAEFARANDDPMAAAYFLDVADCWEHHLEEWTYTTAGALGPGLEAYTEFYERIVQPADDAPDSRRSVVFITNLPGGATFEARSIVDSGFLELVRYGVRDPDDPHVRRTLAAYDAACRVETPRGPCWHRYNHDGYGQKAGGAPYDGTGVGRPWPLLVGERAHYALAAGDRREAVRLRAAMEAFAAPAGMLPEQIWDEDDLPDLGLFRGGPTGAAAPLCWAHAEYVKLLRSLRDGAVFDCPEPVRARYARGTVGGRPHLDIWKFNHKIHTAEAAARIWVEVYGPATLHWSADGWRTVHHDPMGPNGHGVWTHVWPAGSFEPGAELVFTFFWHETRRWEGRNFRIAIT